MAGISGALKPPLVSMGQVGLTGISPSSVSDFDCWSKEDDDGGREEVER